VPSARDSPGAGPVTRIVANICSDRMAETRDFYVGLLGLEVVAEHGDWFIQLASPSKPIVQLGILRRDDAWIPDGFGVAPRGVVLSVEVPDPDAVFAACVRRGIEVVQPPLDEDYGVRHVMITDPNGLLVNVLRHRDAEGAA
jgi:catechol 2,3-dioxygenase-like lactoylglutathione lyase family enzyme